MILNRNVWMPSLTATEVMEGGGDFLACRDFFPRPLPLQDFFFFFLGGGGGRREGSSQVPCTIFLGGGGYFTVAILIFTSHNLIAWNRLLTGAHLERATSIQRL